MQTSRIAILVIIVILQIIYESKCLFLRRTGNLVLDQKSYGLTGDDLDLCSIKLGPSWQGLKVHCERGGRSARKRFLKYLRKNIILPSLIRLGLGTKFCTTLDYIKRVPWVSIPKWAKKQRRGKSLSSGKKDLDDLGEHELQLLLEEVTKELDDKNNNGEGEPEPETVNVELQPGQDQSQSQSQDIQAEIHTHQHIYLVMSSTGEVVDLPAFAGSLNNSSLAEIIDMINAAQEQDHDDSGETASQMEATTSTETSSTEEEGALQSPSPPSTTLSNTPPGSPPSGSGSGSSSTLASSGPSGGPPTGSTSEATNTQLGNTNPSLTGSGGLLQQTLPNLMGDGVFRCGEESKGSTTNFVNKAFPNPDSTDAASEDDDICSFLLHIVDSKVCQIRVDFVQTEMLQPTKGNCVQQYLDVRGTIWPLGVSKFCGLNDGQHFYIELDDTASKKYVEFVVVTKSKHSIGNDFIGGFYKWGLWITQLVCDGSRPLEAPKGCFQYYLESSGTLTSFNFATDGGQANVYLNNEAYRICIVAKKGACRIVYSAEAGDFGLEKFGNYKTSPYSRSGVSSTFCVRDFLRIPDGSASGFLHTSSQDRYCGGHFHSQSNQRENQPVSAPILSRIITVDFRSGDPQLFPTQNSAGVPASSEPFNAVQHRPGFKISYEQVNGNNACPAVNLATVGTYPSTSTSSQSDTAAAVPAVAVGMAFTSFGTGANKN